MMTVLLPRLTRFSDDCQRGIRIHLDDNRSRRALFTIERLQFTANHMHAFGSVDAQRHPMAGDPFHYKSDVVADHNPFPNFPA